MDPARSSPVALAEQRLAWLDSRQRVLSQNIANADTPSYRPRDLRSFDQVVKEAGFGEGPRLWRTDARHLVPVAGDGPRGRPDRRLIERTASGNAVVLDEQALKVAETDSAHALAIGLHRRYLTMFRTALGRPQ